MCDQVPLLREPDQYPAGNITRWRPPFRQVLVLSDALTADMSYSVVEGLQSTRLSLFGIRGNYAGNAGARFWENRANGNFTKPGL